MLFKMFPVLVFAEFERLLRDTLRYVGWPAVMTLLLMVAMVDMMVDMAIAQVNLGSVSSPEQNRVEDRRAARAAPLLPQVESPSHPTAPGGLDAIDLVNGQTGRTPSSNQVRGPADARRYSISGHPGNAPVGAGLPPSVEKAPGGATRSSIPVPQVNPVPFPYSFPWATVVKLLVRFTANGQNVYYLCSAASLSSFHILTAGQCLYNHDILGDGSNIAGWAVETWAWPAQTDVVGPIGVPDFPYGVAKGTHGHTYAAWVDNADLNWDIAWIALDRRIGDRVGWMGMETNTTATSLHFDGYPAEGQYGFANNALQYAGYAPDNVQSYTDTRVYLSAYVYGGQIGGPVWRDDGSQSYLQGVLSTSDRGGNAAATRLTNDIVADIQDSIASDGLVLTPVARPYFIEYSLEGNVSKGLGTKTVGAGGSATVTFNLFNVGFVPSVATVNFYLSSTPQLDAQSVLVGSVALGTVGPNTHLVQTTTLTIPSTMPPGSYYVIWAWSSTVAEYPTHSVTYYWGSGGKPPTAITDNRAVITDQLLTVTGVTESQLQFIPLTPCRVMDTRNPDSPLGGPFIGAGTTRSIPVPSSACGVPDTAGAYALNVTVVPRRGRLGYLTIWPTGQAQPLVSTLNSVDGSVLANAAIVPAGAGGSIDAFATDDTELVVDINGYFALPTGTSLQFYALPPCRVLDTRDANGPFGGPAIQGGGVRSIPVSSGGCGVPVGASAYSLNVTVVPHGPLGYLTAWPTGEAMPLVSTLNSLDGTVLANAAIVPAGVGGAVTFYAMDTTDLVVDINGYFALPGPSGLDFYTVAPCRVVDTREAAAPLGGPLIAGMTARSFPLLSGDCNLPDAAAAYSLNVTAVPAVWLGYLTAWPTGPSRPLVSTLNDPKGLPVANAALLPSGTGGAVSVFVTNDSDVVIDANGYFAP